MFLRLLLLFTIVPLLELFLLVKLGSDGSARTWRWDGCRR